MHLPFCYCCCPIWNKILKGEQSKLEIPVTKYTRFDVVLDAVNHGYLALSKSAVKPTSRSLRILAISYSSASIGGSEKNHVQLPLHPPPPPHTHTHTFISYASNYLPRLATFSYILAVLLLPCEGQVIQPSCLSS